MVVSVLFIAYFLSTFPITYGHITGSKFQDVKDRGHLKQHMHAGMEAEEIREEEVRFHYFNSHDFDGNRKLDGLEILQAFTHYHSEAELSGPSHGIVVYTDKELAAAIDPLLVSAIDKNQDGQLDYGEFILAEKASREF